MAVKRNRYLPGHQEYALKLYDSGLPVRKVALLMRLPHGTVAHWIHQAGVGRRYRPHRYTRAILELYAIGHGASTIARLLDMPVSTTCNILYALRIRRDCGTAQQVRGMAGPPPDHDYILGMARGFKGYPSATELIGGTNESESVPESVPGGADRGPVVPAGGRMARARRARSRR